MSLLGLGYRPVHYSQVINDRPKIDFFEIISENFMGVGGNPNKKLTEVRANYPIAMHGVSLSVAGTAAIDMKYLRCLKDLVDTIDPFIVSDHLCFTSDEKNRQSYDLLPIPYNQANLCYVISRVYKIQDFLGRQLILENPSCYVSWKNSEMHEAEFLAELCRATGAGVLLDLNNLIVNQKNLGFDPKIYFDLLKKYIRQFHIAGHRIQNGFAIDTHDQPVEEAVWSLLKIAKSHCPNAPILLEWDDHIPSLEDLCRELMKVKLLGEIPSVNEDLSHRDSRDHAPIQLGEGSWEKQFLGRNELIEAVFSYDKTASEETCEAFSKDTPLKPQIGLGIYKSSYFARIKSALKETCPNLYFIVEEEGLTAITKFFLMHKNDSHWSLNNIGRSLVEILKKEKIDFDFGVEQDLIADLAQVDHFNNESFLSIDDSALSPSDLHSMGPEDLETKKFCLTISTLYFVSRWNILPLIEQISSLKLLKEDASSVQACDSLTPNIPDLDSKLIVITRQKNKTRISNFAADKKTFLDYLSKARFLHEVIPSAEPEDLKFFLDLIEIGAVKEV